MTGPRATIEDVARAADVSVATVSRALRGMPNVAPPTRARVAAVAADLGYTAHPAAASLASGRTSTFGLVAPFFELWFTGQVLAGVLAAMSEAAYDLVIYTVDTPENRTKFVDRVATLSVRLDGLLLVDFFPDESDVAGLAASGAPVVVLGEEIDAFPSVAIDNEAAAQQAVQHLYDLGHRRIGLLGGDEIAKDGSPVLTARRAGYRNALERLGLEHDDALEFGGSLSVEGGAGALGAIAEMREPPTAVFCMSDEMAMGAMGRARELEISVPADLSVIGFDGHDLAEPFGLTTMTQPVVELGRTITSWLLDIAAGPRPYVSAGRAPHVSVPVVLTERSSTAPPPSRH